MKTTKNKINIADLIKEKDNAIKELIDLDKVILLEKDKDIAKMIDYYNGLTAKIEERRTMIQQFTFSIMAILIPAIVLINQYYENIKNIFWLLLIICFIQMISSILIIILFEKQQKFSYFFNKGNYLGNKWKWFYHGSAEIKNISTRPILISDNEEKTTIPFFKGMKMFIENYKNETIKVKIENDIQQLFLLQVHNYYKNKFFLQLSNIRLYSFYISLMWVAAYYLFMLFCR